jgi:hypothetical protein
MFSFVRGYGYAWKNVVETEKSLAKRGDYSQSGKC